MGSARADHTGKYLSTLSQSTMETGVCREVGSRPSWRPPRLSSLLAVVVVVLTVLPTTRGDCAVVHPKCRCGDYREVSAGIDYGYSIVCKHMGSIVQVPPLRATDKPHGALVISNDTVMSTVQRGAFEHLHVKVIRLRSLGITLIQPEAFRNVIGLLHILLDYNSVETIGLNAFDGLSELKTLTLTGNRLKTVDGWWSEAPPLQELILVSNRIETIADGAFNGLDQLKILDLSDNRLKTATAILSGEWAALEELSFSKNNIQTIPGGMYFGIIQIRILDLSQNRIKTMSMDLFMNLPNFGSLRIYNNSLVCDCELAYLRDINPEIIQYNPLCASPPSVKGKSVVAYDIEMCFTTMPERAAAAASTSSRAKEDITAGMSTTQTRTVTTTRPSSRVTTVVTTDPSTPAPTITDRPSKRPRTRPSTRASTRPSTQVSTINMTGSSSKVSTVNTAAPSTQTTTLDHAPNFNLEAMSAISDDGDDEPYHNMLTIVFAALVAVVMGGIVVYVIRKQWAKPPTTTADDNDARQEDDVTPAVSDTTAGASLDPLPGETDVPSAV